MSLPCATCCDDVRALVRISPGGSEGGGDVCVGVFLGDMPLRPRRVQRSALRIARGKKNVMCCFANWFWVEGLLLGQQLACVWKGVVLGGDVSCLFASRVRACEKGGIYADMGHFIAIL